MPPSHDTLAPFLSPAAVASYGDETRRKVPGLADLHRMTALLLAERAPRDGRILVVGAGGGLELGAMAQAQPAWRFTGVDPSPAMLALARQVTAPDGDRIDLHCGTVDHAPEGPFDGATCLLTLHFLDRAERRRTLKDIRRRLAPGAALVVAHHSVPDDEGEREGEEWLARSAVFADREKSDPVRAAASARTMVGRLPLLSPRDDEALLLEAGFDRPALFYAAFSFRGWVAFAGNP